MLVIVAALISACTFPRMGGHSPEYECKVHLRAIAAAQQSMRDETGVYETQVSRLGFEIERGNRALLLLDRKGPIRERRGVPDPTDGAIGFGPDSSRRPELTTASLLLGLDPKLRAEAGLRGDCRTGSCGFTAICVLNLDSDPDVAVWTISTDETIDLDGKRIPPLDLALRMRDRD